MRKFVIELLMLIALCLLYLIIIWFSAGVYGQTFKPYVKIAGY